MSLLLPIQDITAQRRSGFFMRVLAFMRHPRVDPLDRCILVFAVLAPFTNIPQILKIYTEGHADLSLTSWSLYVLFNIPLFTHGLIRRDRIVLFNTLLTMVMQLCVVTGILLYR